MKKATIDLTNCKYLMELCFDTGWMINPDGKINLNTPYGGK